MTLCQFFPPAVFDEKRKKYDLQGFYFWTLKSNYEWSEGYLQKFGMYYSDGGKKVSAYIYEAYMKKTLAPQIAPSVDHDRPAVVMQF